jgi:hypothetical protein
VKNRTPIPPQLPIPAIRVETNPTRRSSKKKALLASKSYWFYSAIALMLLVTTIFVIQMSMTNDRNVESLAYDNNEDQTNESDGAHDSLQSQNNRIPPISKPDGNNHLVLTHKMALDTGLRLTISFLCIGDKTDPGYESLDGVAGVVLLENVISDNDHQLPNFTRLKIFRGNLPLLYLGVPKCDRTNQYSVRWEYDNYTPLDLLFFLRGKGEIGVEVNGTRYVLTKMWRQHLMEALEETLVQKERIAQN